METSRARTLILFVTAAAVVVLGVGPGHAIDKCKVKVDKKTGVILVDASGVGGPLTWGEQSGSETNAFFNAGTCVAGDKAKRCQLADPVTLASKTAPEGCTLYLDDTVQACSAWISGCSPGARQDSGVVLKDANGVFIGNVVTPQGTSAIREESGRAVSLPIQSEGQGFESNGSLLYLSNDCTGSPLSYAQSPVVAPVVVFGTTGYFPPSTGSLQNTQSYLSILSLTTSQASCDSLYGPGSTHVPPNGCCFLQAFAATLGAPLTLDLSIYTPPFVAEVD